MKRLHAGCLGLLLAGIAAAGQAASGFADLESWFVRDLVPYVKRELTTHPRFRNESFRFVVMQDDSPQSEGSALAINLRDRLRDALTDVPGIRIAWQAEQPGVGLVAGSSGLDCTRNEASYFIGIELQETSPGQASVNVRALDIEERTWAAGFGRVWRGAVGPGQRRGLRMITSDPTFRGERHAPWDDSETDLMAAHLAYELGCKLLRQTAGEYILAATAADRGEAARNALVELVGNNLAGIPSLQFAADPDHANAHIEGKAHRIDDDLYQYWVTITPDAATSELKALSADAYIRIPDRYAAATLVPEAVYELPRNDDGFLASLRIVRLRDQRMCLSQRTAFAGASNSIADYGYATEECYALQLQSSNDAVVFFLHHQLNNGLVRLSGGNCSPRSAARIARTDKDLRFPLPLDSLRSGSWSAEDSWSLHPDQDTFYAIASSDSKAARALSRHIERLPKRCSLSVRSGLEGAGLRRWLEELSAIVDHWKSDIDWQSVRVKNVY